MRHANAGILRHKIGSKRNKRWKAAYNIVVEFLVSDRMEHSGFLAYFYSGVSGAQGVDRAELDVSGERAVCRVFAESLALPVLLERMTEIVAVGYKYRFLDGCVRVGLRERERALLLSALIAADLEGDRQYILPRLASEKEYCLDGLFAFRMGELREKWERIAAYIPEEFSKRDLINFSTFLVQESCRTVYLKESEVYGENFRRLRLSRLTGRECAEREIVLADAGYVKCLGGVSDGMGEFLKNYYAGRTVFS